MASEKRKKNRREIPLDGQVLARTDFMDSYDSDRTVITDIQNATLITSMVSGSTGHKPVLDIDLPVTLLPSSTPGHFHLFIDKEMEWPVYLDLLRALSAAGIIEEGYLGAAIRREHTAVRLPWICKAIKPPPIVVDSPEGGDNGD